MSEKATTKTERPPDHSASIELSKAGFRFQGNPSRRFVLVVLVITVGIVIARALG